MKKWPETASGVHEVLMAGVFVGWRADGSHNSSVSFDMLLEQTYNADAKEASVLDGITLSRVSAELKSMLHLHPSNPHHVSSGHSPIYSDHIILAQHIYRTVC